MLKLIDQSLLRSQLYIDGKWVSADDGATVSVFNPATKDEVIAAADAGAAEACAARGPPGYCQQHEQSGIHVRPTRAPQGSAGAKRADTGLSLIHI